MKRNPIKKKLDVRKETISLLRADLTAVNGGYFTKTCPRQPIRPI
jgi:hypothetical protein